MGLDVLGLGSRACGGDSRRSTASFFGTKLSYAAGLGFMRNMQVVIGNKVSRLPLGWFKADSAGRLSRMVTQEMISTGQAAALYVGQLIKNAAAAIVFCAAVWLWSWQIGIMLTLSIQSFPSSARFTGMRRKGNGLEDSAERDIAARIVEFARCQGSLRACRAGADYAELEDSFVEGRKRSVRGLWWSALGRNPFRGERADARCEHDHRGELLGCKRKHRGA